MNRSSARAQAKHIITGCLGKRGYETQEEAKQKGQREYKCIYCPLWHRASIKKPMPQAMKNGIPVLDNPKKKKPAPDERAQLLKRLERAAQIEAEWKARGQRINELCTALERQKAENHRLRLRYDRTIEGRACKLYYNARARLRKWRKL